MGEQAPKERKEIRVEEERRAMVRENFSLPQRLPISPLL